MQAQQRPGSMLLSPCRDSPYRTPTPQNPDSSPKRKRANSESTSASAPAPNEVLPLEHKSTKGSDSPRMKVAEKLRDLEIQTPRKRVKYTGYLPSDSAQKSSSRSAAPVYSDETEIEETPDCRSLPHLSSSPSIAVRALRAAGEQHATVHDTPESNAKDSTLSPPPATSASPPNIPDQIALTWQESEITGQDIDASSPDDSDGLGINGIGFKPTPAMAYARSQKRKQQVSEWRAREAREARQRRLERRRGEEEARTRAPMVKFHGDMISREG